MVQRVEYTVLNDVRDQDLLIVTQKVLGFIARTQPKYKALREWLREDGLWDKEQIGLVFDFLDVRAEKKKKAVLGSWARGFLEADGQQGQREYFFERMLSQNSLLVKYVFEALDTDGGGRLHSTYELHRMLTSYVYPGEAIGLPAFQAWIKWMVGAGYVKLIGIRWGLTEEGKEVVPRLRMIDVDEFLEDEAEEAEEAEHAEIEEAVLENSSSGAARQEASAPSPASLISSPNPPLAASLSSAKNGQEVNEKEEEGKMEVEEEDEELPDMPPEAPPVDDQVFARYEADMADEATLSETEATSSVSGPTTSRPTTPRPTLQPAIIVNQARVEVACTREPLDMPTVINDLRSYGRAQGLKAGGSLFLAHGLLNRMAESEAARHLFLAGLLARLYAARPDGAYADLLVERAGGLGPVAILLDRPEVLGEVIVRWGFAQPDPAAIAVRSALLDAVIGGRTLKAKPDMPGVLAEAVTSEVLVGMLTQGMLRGASALTPFWLIREMVRAGLWTHEAAGEIACVPSRSVRLMAYRLHIIDTHFAQGTARLIDTARAIVRLLSPGSVEALAFDALAPSDHLRFDCRQVEICQQPCGLDLQD